MLGHGGSDDVTVFTNDGHGALAFHSRTLLPSLTLHQLMATDVDGDAAPDILVVQTWNPPTRSRVYALQDDGSGRFAAPRELRGLPEGIEAVEVADTDGDGHPDLVVGNGGFTRPQLVSTGGAQPTAVAVVDVTGDGAPDFLVANHFSHEFVVLPGDGRGSFHPPVHAVTAGLWPVALEVADIDGGGAGDVVADNAFSGLVSVHRKTNVLAHAAPAVRP